MNRKVLAGLASAVLLGSAAMWLHRSGNAETVSVPAVADRVPPIQAPHPPEPAPVASLPAKEEAPPKLAQARTREEAFPTNPGTGAGFYNKHMTVELEPVLASRISNRILNAPRQQMMTGELAVVMARRNHGLETELERACNSGK